MEDVQWAAKSVYPNRNRSRYSNVYVLIFKSETEDPNLPVDVEIDDLCKVLDQIYGCEIEIFQIPDQKSHNRVVEKVSAFIGINDDSKDDLKIVYYAGHSGLSEQSREQQIGPTVTYAGIRHSLEQAESDVLILFDSCSSGICDAGVGNGVTELISACTFDVIANGVGHYSFTNALTTELRALSRNGSFPVVDLYNRLYIRMKSYLPRGLKNERYPAPIRFQLTRDKAIPRSISLSVRKRATEQCILQGSTLANYQIPVTEQGSSKRREGHEDDGLCSKRACLNRDNKALPITITDSAAKQPDMTMTFRSRMWMTLESKIRQCPTPRRLLKASVPYLLILKRQLISTQKMGQGCCSQYASKKTSKQRICLQSISQSGYVSFPQWL